MERQETKPRKSGRVLLWSVAGIAVIAAAGVVGGKVMLEKTIRTSLENSGASAESVDVGFTGRVNLRDVTIPMEDDHTLHIASVEGRPEFLFFSGMIDAKGLQLDAGKTQMTIPDLKVEDAGLNRAFLAAATGENGLTMAERAERISAGHIAVSKIDVTQSFEGVQQTASYSDLVLNDIVAGHIGTYASSGMDMRMKLLPGDAASADNTPDVAEISIGKIEGQDVDIPFLARVYTEARPAEGDNAPQQVYGPLTAQNMVIETEEARVTYDALRSDGFSMRQADKPVLDTIEALQAVSDVAKVSPEDQQRIGLEALSLADVFAKANVQLSGMALTSTDEPDMEFAIDELAFDMDDKVFGFSLEGLDIRSGEDAITLKSASWTDISLTPTLAGFEALLEAGPKSADTWSEVSFLPELGTFTMTDYAVDLNPVEGEDNGFDVDEPVNFTLKQSTIVMRKPFNGIPTDIRFAIDGFNLNLAQLDDNEAVDLLKQLGYEDITVSQDIKAHWDKADNVLIIDNISFGGEDMGRVSFSGSMGGFGEAFFSGDKAMMQAALFGLTAREATLKIENDGLFAKGLKLYADENGMNPDQARLTLSMLPSIAAQSFGDGDPSVQAVVDAVSAFVANPNTLEVSIKAKSEQGIGAPALMTATMNPTSLLKQVDITATAE